MLEFFFRFFNKKAPKALDESFHVILSKHSSYYQKLNEPLRTVFRQRIFHLLNVLTIKPGRMPTVTREMAVVIACGIIEITFGLKNYIPVRFTRIMVLPRRYKYPGFGEPFLGHIDFKKAVIYFSWEDVQQGYFVKDDAVNVALHEMAHVLEAESNFRHIWKTFFDDFHWEAWAKVAFEKMRVIRGGNNDFLKSYGGENMREMFAVCVETFFEQPEAFKATLPHIYDKMVALLKQDLTFPGNPLTEDHQNQMAKKALRSNRKR